jgi:hypothetical protein
LRCMLKVQSDPKHIRSQVEILQNTWKMLKDMLRYIPDYPFCNVQNLLNTHSHCSHRSQDRGPLEELMEAQQA